jgi:glycosyltransferase involved in cell wall biosynthesis
MSTYPTISVVVPTYNCRQLLIAHLGAMQAWLDLIEEVIVVDSRSTDGTLDLIRSELRHPRLRIIERDRGLYASWNEGIAATTGDWVYISTAGDLITREQLLHLRAVGEALSADVVVSPPDFAHEDGRPHRDLGWPPAKLLAAFGQGHPFVMATEATQCLAFQECPNALLGSSAANLYRGAHLRAKPFPVEYGVVGDTAWIMRYGHETRLALTPQRGSTFCIHEKESRLTPGQSVDLHGRLLSHESTRLAEAQQIGPMLASFLSKQELTMRTKKLWAEKRQLWHAPENRVTNKLRWVSVTSRYLWSRLRDKRRAQETVRSLQTKPAFFTHLAD